MIVLDTNIISEIMKVAPCEKVMCWVNEQDTNQLFITTITIAEISYGLVKLPLGKRRSTLENTFNHIILNIFKYRILSFDEPAAYLFGEIMARRKKLGRPIAIPDGQIASIARANWATIATRNNRDFIDCGLDVINPFVNEIF